MTTPVNDGATTEADDWRGSIHQSFRNAEVREIAKVLASLEPGSKESSKLRLAMQFEDSVFKSAASLDDYRKRLTKRLKKVQKSYKPPVKDESQQTTSNEHEIQVLRQKYGDAVRYVIQHSTAAFNEMKEKHGEAKAIQLRQHMDCVHLWAADLGLADAKSKPNLSISAEQLKKLKDHLERRLENIRFHVVKLAEPDRFLAENLEKVENDFKVKHLAASILAEWSKKRFESWQKKTFDPTTLLTESFEQANKTIPLPTRIQQNDNQATIIHLDKMRAAGTALFSYMAIKDKSKVPANTLVRMHNVSLAGCEFVQNAMREHRKEQGPEEITLQDAWMKPLILQLPASNNDIVLDTFSSPTGKRLKVSHSKPVLRTQVLLTPNRKIPTNVLRNLKRKRASLIRPPPSGHGSHLILEFGKAFTMEIFFVPLVVNIRAYNKKEASDEEELEPSSEWKCASWTPLHSGLTDSIDELTVYGVKGTHSTLGSVVEERLRDCSAHATNTLRKCFAKHAKEDRTLEFEIEIYEASALFEFLQLARTTYIPNWEDDDVYSK